MKVDLPKHDLKKVYDQLWNQHKLAIALTPAGDSRGLRFSPHVYTSMSEVDRAVEALRQAARI